MPLRARRRSIEYGARRDFLAWRCGRTICVSAHSTVDPSALRDLIAWYAAMGVDVALDEAPVDRLAPAQPTPARAVPTRPSTALPSDRPQPRPSAPAPLPRVAVPPAVAAPTGEIERAAR